MATGVKLRDFPGDGVAQLGRGIGHRVAAVVDEVPKLAVLTQEGVGPQGIPHLGPPNRAAQSAMNKDDRIAAVLVGLSEIDSGFDTFDRREELRGAQLPETRVVQSISEGR
jgi:hypothetical protein